MTVSNYHHHHPYYHFDPYSYTYGPSHTSYGCQMFLSPQGMITSFVTINIIGKGLNLKPSKFGGKRKYLKKTPAVQEKWRVLTHQHEISIKRPIQYCQNTNEYEKKTQDVHKTVHRTSMQSHSHFSHVPETAGTRCLQRYAMLCKLCQCWWSQRAEKWLLHGRKMPMFTSAICSEISPCMVHDQPIYQTSLVGFKWIDVKKI